jgi:DNA-binding NarL/FixJ family response regulator
MESTRVTPDFFRGSNSRIDVLLIEDDLTVCQIVGALIEKQSKLNLLGSINCLRDGMTWLRTISPSVLIVDLKLKDGSGIDLIKACTILHPHCLCMVLTASNEDNDIVAAIEAGARGYILKDEGLYQIADAIRYLWEGGSPMSSEVIRKLISQRADKDGHRSALKHPDALLTARETSVLDLLGQGLSYAEIATELGISIMTVQNYIKRIYKKMSVNSRGKAVFEAKRWK